jgi:hypothetical protein
LLRIKPNPGNSIRLNVIRITRVGREIASILPAEHECVALRAVADAIQDSAESIELCLVTQRNLDGSVSFNVYEAIKQKPLDTKS